MTTYDLMIKVKEALEAKGFETSLPNIGEKPFEYQGWGTKDGKSWRTPVEGYTFTNLNGHTVNFEVVYRRNGTNENQSVDISVMAWKNSCGYKRLIKERIRTNMSDKSISNRINKVIEVYEAV